MDRKDQYNEIAEFKSSPLFELKDMINSLLTSSSPAPIYKLRTSYQGHRSEWPENNLVHNIQYGIRTRLARGVNIERFLIAML